MPQSEEYCIYLRKSRADVEAEERGEEETLARHKRALFDVARRLKLNVTQVYSEVVSGETIAARPVMQALLADVDSGKWAGVLVMEVERLARGDTTDQGIVAQAFKYSDTKIVTPIKTYDPSNEYDEEYFEFGLFMSRREYKTINRRLQRGRVASVKEGRYVANKTPYGYIRRKLEKEKGFTLDPHPEQAPIVRMIFDWYTHGEPQPDGSMKRIGASMITRKLNNLGILPRSGKFWVPASVRDILINPVYAGKLRWNWRPAVKRMTNGQVTISRPRNDPDKCVIVDGLHEGIIDLDTFEVAQELMSQNPPRPVGERNTVKNPLSGLVVCGVCGRKMIRRPYYKREQADTLLCYLTACSNISSPLASVEARILDALAAWLQEYKLQWDASDVKRPGDASIKTKQQALKKASQELEELDRQRGNIHDLLERGVYDTDTFLERSRTIAERTNQAKQAVDALTAEIALDVAREESRQRFIPRVEHLLSVYNELPSPQQKNDLLKEVLEKVVYTKTVNGRWHHSPDDFEIVLYPRLPTSHL